MVFGTIKLPEATLEQKRLGDLTNKGVGCCPDCNIIEQSGCPPSPKKSQSNLHITTFSLTAPHPSTSSLQLTGPNCGVLICTIDLSLALENCLDILPTRRNLANRLRENFWALSHAPCDGPGESLQYLLFSCFYCHLLWHCAPWPISVELLM